MRNLNVVQVEVNQLGVIVLDPLNGLLDVCAVWRIHGEELLLRRLGDPVPAHAHRLALVEQRGMVLVLVHHRVEAQNGGQIDDLLLRGVVESVFILLAQIDGDLFLGLDVPGIPWRGHPLLAAHLALDEGLELWLVGGLDSLLVDVLDQLLAVQRPGGILGALIAAALIRRQEVVLKERYILVSFIKFCDLTKITHIGIHFFGQYGYLLGRELGQQTLHIHIIVLAQVLAIQLGRSGERGCLCGG